MSPVSCKVPSLTSSVCLAAPPRVDPYAAVSKNSDKFYCMQVIESRGPPVGTGAPAKTKGGRKKKAPQYWAFSRWGRSGTGGTCMLEGPFDDVDDAKEVFRTKFKQKSGRDWDETDGSNARYTQAKGKYKVGKKNYTTKRSAGMWQYYLGAPQDGKSAGWYDYDVSASEIVDDVWQQWQDNPGNGLDVRCVESGIWAYRVDFNTMTQTNVKHPAHTTRSIRRDSR